MLAGALIEINFAGSNVSLGGGKLQELPAELQNLGWKVAEVNSVGKDSKVRDVTIRDVPLKTRQRGGQVRRGEFKFSARLRSKREEKAAVTGLKWVKLSAGNKQAKGVSFYLEFHLPLSFSPRRLNLLITTQNAHNAVSLFCGCFCVALQILIKTMW